MSDWVNIEKTDKCILSWEYMSDENDEDTYESGNLYTDDDDDKTIIDYDGCYNLPYAIYHELKNNGYDVSEIYI